MSCEGCGNAGEAKRCGADGGTACRDRGGAGGLNDGVIIAHIVDHAEETVVEQRYGLAEARFQRRDGGAERGLRALLSQWDRGGLLFARAHAQPLLLLCRRAYIPFAGFGQLWR